MEKDNNELMNISEHESLDGRRALSISDISDDFINSKIDVKDSLIRNENIEIDSDSKLNNIIISSKFDSQKVLEQNSNIQVDSNIQEIDMSYDDFDMIRLACEGFRLNHDKSEFRNRVDDVLFNIHIPHNTEVYLAHYRESYGDFPKVDFAITSKGIYRSVLSVISGYPTTFSKLSKVSNIYWKDNCIYGDDKAIAYYSGEDFVKDDLVDLFCMIKRISYTLRIE